MITTGQRKADANRLLDKVDKWCLEAEVKNRIALVTEVSSLMTKSKLKRNEIEETKQVTEIAEKKLNLIN